MIRDLKNNNFMRLLAMFALWLACTTAMATPFDVVFTHQPVPAYPAEMLQARLSGLVSISFVIHNDGTVSRVRILKSTHPGFEKDVVATVSQWRFEPWRVTRKAPRKIEARNLLVFTEGGASF